MEYSGLPALYGGAATGRGDLTGYLEDDHARMELNPKLDVSEV